MDVGKRGRRNQGLAGLVGFQQGTVSGWTIPIREDELQRQKKI